MKKRLFIALPLTHDIQDKAFDAIKQFPRFPKPIRFISEINWHSTLIFLGYQDETVISKIEDSLYAFTEKSTTRDSLQKLIFDAIVYGPTDGTPRMIWLTTNEETSKLLGSLRGSLDTELSLRGIVWKKEFRPFKGHITLAKFEPTPRRELPELQISFCHPFSVSAFYLMESILKRSGAEYRVISKIDC